MAENKEKVLAILHEMVELFSKDVIANEIPSAAAGLVNTVPAEVVVPLIQGNTLESLDTCGIFWGYRSVAIHDLMDGNYPNHSFVPLLEVMKEYVGFYQPPFLAVDRYGEVECPSELNYQSELFAIFQSEEQFVYYNNCINIAAKGIVGETDSIGVYLAPSLLEHVSDLHTGLENSTYLFNGHHIVFPQAWCDRVGLREGRLKMDEFGGVS